MAPRICQLPVGDKRLFGTSSTKLFYFLRYANPNPHPFLAPSGADTNDGLARCDDRDSKSLTGRLYYHTNAESAGIEKKKRGANRRNKSPIFIAIERYITIFAWSIHDFRLDSRCW